MFVEYDKFDPDKIFLIPTGYPRKPFFVGYKYEEKEGPLYVKGPILKSEKGIEYIRKPSGITPIIMVEIPRVFLSFWENLYTKVLQLCKANRLNINLKCPINIPEDETRTIYKVFDVPLYNISRFYTINSDEDIKHFDRKDLDNVTMSFIPQIFFDDLFYLDNKGVMFYHIDSGEVISIEKNKLFGTILDKLDMDQPFRELKLDSK